MWSLNYTVVMLKKGNYASQWMKSAHLRWLVALKLTTVECNMVRYFFIYAFYISLNHFLYMFVCLSHFFNKPYILLLIHLTDILIKYKIF